MNNKLQTKKQWQAPQIFDLDVKDTMSGTNTKLDETTAATSSIFAPASS